MEKYKVVHALSDKKGFTLVEFLVSIVILMVGLLGLLQAVNISLSQSLQNDYRNEARELADEEMAKELSKGTKTAGFAAISTVTKTYNVQRKVLSAFKQYSVVKSGLSRTTNSKEVDISVSWSYKKAHYDHSISSLVSLSQQ